MEHDPLMLEQVKLSGVAKDVIAAAWKSRKRVAAIVGAITLTVAAGSLLLPDYFRSTATILPETERSKLPSLGNLSDLASLAGIETGEGSLVKLYPRIISSESVLRNVIYARYYSRRMNDSVNLVQFWEIDEKNPELIYEKTLKTLREQLEVGMDPKTLVVTISIDTREPGVSAAIVNKVTEELDRFIRTKRITNASEQRKWIETRLSEVEADLAKSEESLKEFREKNRRIIDSPELLLEQDRLVRELQINSTLYTELKKQYELIKIEEIKNIPIINVLDPGRPAARKERPRRSIIVIDTFFISLIGAVGYVYFRRKYAVQIEHSLLAFRRLVRGA
ncbi:MAG TPA: hypothetical protein VMG34_09575 [Bacteroidota bacterium]|nr:hypothetical protein [Bacteroidota bacterium]